MFEITRTMSEGRSPEPSDSHNWNKENGIDARKRQRAELAREDAESKQKLRSERIDDHIAFLQRQAARPSTDWLAAGRRVDRDTLERAAVVQRMKYERKAGVYSYIRDTH